MSAPDKPVVIVVGSLHYDIVVDAPDRPRKGETLAGSAWRPKFGGKGGNQAIAAATAGAAVRMVGAVGDDDFGRFLLAGLAVGVEASHVAILPRTRSGMSVAISDATGDYGAVIVSGANLHIDPHRIEAMGVWEGADALILQNEVAEDVNLAAARAARSRNVKVCLNAAPFRPIADAMMSLVDCLIVNAIEAEELCGLAVMDLPSAAAAADRLSAKVPTVVVTAGSAGVAGVRRGEEAVAIEAVPVPLVSTHGAGDVFSGVFAAAFAAGASFAESLDEANAAAAAHVSKRRET